MNKFRLAIPMMVGNALEFYDFSLVGYFAPIIAKIFFHGMPTVIAILHAFAIYAVGFLARPFGGVFFGYLGDRYGRKKSLAITILLMASVTLLIGLLPTAESLGILPALGLIILRMIQGIALGGEIAGSFVYMVEHAPPLRRGLFGSLTLVGANLGFLLGSIVGYLVSSSLDSNDILNWGWRIPFLLGSVIGFVGLYFRLYMPETAIFSNLASTHRVLHHPLREAFKTAKFELLIAFGLLCFAPLIFNLTFVYLSYYLTSVNQLSVKNAFGINAASMFVLLLFLPIAGALSDKIGRRYVFYLAAIGTIFFAYPIFVALAKGSYLAVLFAQFILAILAALANGAMPATLCELFPTNIRYTGVSITLNVGNALFAGTAPWVCTYFVNKIKIPLAPAFYLMVAAGIMLITLWSNHSARIGYHVKLN